MAHRADTAVVVLLAATLMLLAAAPPVRGQTPPPMFSPWYAEALRGVLDLDEAGVARLEQQLAAHPDDFAARLKLMAYHQRADRSHRPEASARRLQHALWLIEHDPSSELLHSPVSLFSRADLSETDYRRAVALWESAAKTRSGDAAVAWNAASFFQGLDTGLHMSYLEATAAADPNHAFALRPLAHLYARLTLERGPLASRARAVLEASNNVWVLGNAAYTFQSLYNHGLQMGSPDPLAAGLAERYFLRAKALDPRLERKVILPQIDIEEVRRRWQAQEEERPKADARLEEAASKIRRLPVSAFPQLPPAIVAVLEARRCSVPQPWTGKGPYNVIRGEFFRNGEPGWAVLCSVKGSTDLLVFRTDRDANPETLNTTPEANHLQGVGGDEYGYSRQITAAGRDYILRCYRVHGGPEPPPLDHHGIEDVFLEKASTILYSHQGKWLRLPAAD